MNRAFLILGGNLGDRSENLARARYFIEQEAGTIQQMSSIYESEPWGVQSQPDYYNQVLEISTSFPAEDLLTILLQIEQKMGRIRSVRNESRIIDIDILFMNDEIHHSSRLNIPHPRLHLRLFVLEPFNEIAPQFRHPVMGKTIRELLDICPDKSYLKKIIPAQELPQSTEP
jgi:2-amino-4-hydroxy-6-hydroxymethyldihydropteridine diphosphokinase